MRYRAESRGKAGRSVSLGWRGQSSQRGVKSAGMRIVCGDSNLVWHYCFCAKTSRLEPAVGPVTTTSIDNAAHLECSVMGHRIMLHHDAQVFKPTLTTAFLTDQVDRARLVGSAALDLGCGTGPIAIALALSGARVVYAVDLMAQACELAARNATLNGVANTVSVRRGDLFAPVSGLQFDVIVDDVSGVADEVARLSSWFPSSVPSGGPDGTSHTVRMLKESIRFLRPRGYLLFPILSLSRFHFVLEVAADVYGKGLRKVESKLIPFNAELKHELATLRRLQSAGIVDFVQVRSRYFWTLDIYRASVE